MSKSKKTVTCIECQDTFVRTTAKTNLNYICGQCNTILQNKKRAKHNEAGSRLYMCWQDMKRRCYNSNYEGFHNYGGRGIIVEDKEWLTSFVTFRDWALNNGYKDNLTLERIDSNDNYKPSNCCWLTKKENSYNRRYHKVNLEKAREIRFIRETQKLQLKEIAEMFNCSVANISLIVNNKIWVEEECPS